MFDRVDIASLVYFRVAFGAIMLVEVWRYFNYGWIPRYYMAPTFHFTYYGFDWVRPWPGNWMYVHFYALGALAICIMLGYWYRLTAALFFLGFTYVFLLEQARYLNHFYLVSLISFLLIFVPAHRALSIDAWMDPKVRSETAPAWTLWLLRAQIGIAYFYAGLAKLNPDWLRGEPLRMWLAARASRPLLGPLFTQEWFVYLFSYGGLLLDLLVVPLLLWRRTRALGLALAIVFNLLNAWLFSIGIFPWLMIAATLLFFPPEWPRRLVAWTRGMARMGNERMGASTCLAASSTTASLTPGQRLTVVLLGSYLAVQLLFPLRHYLYPGDVSWTEEGHVFSWHMKLRDKKASVQFLATDPVTNLTWQVNPLTVLTRWQFDDMSGDPDMILQFSHYLASELRRQRFEQVEVRANVVASLNGRPPQYLIDPTVNLAAQPRTLLPADWIVSLN